MLKRKVQPPSNKTRLKYHLHQLRVDHRHLLLQDLEALEEVYLHRLPQQDLEGLEDQLLLGLQLHRKLQVDHLHPQKLHHDLHKVEDHLRHPLLEGLEVDLLLLYLVRGLVVVQLVREVVVVQLVHHREILHQNLKERWKNNYKSKLV